MALPPRAAHAREQLKHVLGQLNVGDALPPERELAETFGVSRMTLRRAVDELVLAGTLERRPGSGTYVSRSRLTRRIAMTSFSEDMRRRGLTPETRMISFESKRADRLAARRLRIPVGETVYEFSRLRLADGLPLAVETTIVPVALVPGLRRDDLETSWYQLLADRWGIVVDRATLDIHAVLPPSNVVEMLEVDKRQPCVQLLVESADRRGSVVELGRSYFRGDRYSLRAELLDPSAS